MSSTTKEKALADEKLKSSLLLYISLMIGVFIVCWGPFHLFMILKAGGINLTNTWCGKIQQGVKV